MVGSGGLTFQEFAVGEPLPLSAIHAAVLEFLRGREDTVVFGAFAVNAYVSEPRMTEDVDVMSVAAREVASGLRESLARRFRIAVRIQEIEGGRGFRLYQVQKTGNRHLADVRLVDALPPPRRLGGILVIEPVELIASKVIALRRRRGSPKSGTDWRDLAALLLTFPELKRDPGPVTDRLLAQGVDAGVLLVWHELVSQEIRHEDDEGEFA